MYLKLFSVNVIENDKIVNLLNLIWVYHNKMWRKDSIVLLALGRCLTLSSRNVLQWD